MSDSYIGSEPIFRGVAVLGFLSPIAHTKKQLHLGPELDLGFDAGESTTDWTVSAKVRARWFVDGSLFVIESGAGPVFERFAFNTGLATGTRIGHEWDLAFGFAGIAGPFATGAILADPSGQTDTNLRLTAGVRMNLIAWVAALAGPALKDLL